MTNKLYNFLFIIGILIFSVSCDKDRLNLLPEQSLDESVAFSSVATARAALNGVYSQAQLIEVFGSQPHTIEDYLSDNTEFVGSFPTFQEIFQYITTTPNISIQNIWQVHYRVINGANLVIDNVPNIIDPALNENVQNELLGQAKFLRGIVYMQLVNQFAHPYTLNNGTSLGVPLVLKGFTGQIEYPSRATVGEVHQQIVKDLTEARDHLAAAQFSRGAVRASASAANGYLSRLHLYRGEYQQAANFAKLVLDANYTPAADLKFYNTRNSEWVFVIGMTAVDNSRTGAGGWASYHRPATQGGRGDCAFTASLEAAFAEEAGDLRFSELSDIVTAADQVQRRMTRKYPDGAGNSDDAPMMRISEMHLTRAEALAQLNGVNQESIDLVNPIRVRAGLSPWTLDTFNSKDALVDAILNERRKELCFEGHRRMDLLRIGKELRAGNPNTAPGASRTVLPIPQREIDLNTSLVQNPGY
jgi:hypothetical protein